MDGLRVILLILGVVVIVGVYFLARSQTGKSARQQARVEQREPVIDLDASEFDPDDHEAPVGPDGEAEDSGFDAEPAADVLAQELTRMEQIMREEPRQDRFVANDEPLVIPATKPRSSTRPPFGDEVKSSTKKAPQDPVSAAATASPAAGAVVQEKIIALHVMAPSHTPFRGKDLLKAFELVGLHYGEMKIYHRMMNNDGSLKDAYFIANMVKPGTFEPDAMEQFSSPGISLILQLPGPVDGVVALDDMVATAQKLTGELNGELRDETRSALSRQRIEHLRGEVMEFQRKLRVQRAKA